MSKTNLSVHEDKNRVPYVKVNMISKQCHWRGKLGGWLCLGINRDNSWCLSFSLCAGLHWALCLQPGGGDGHHWWGQIQQTCCCDKYAQALFLLFTKNNVLPVNLIYQVSALAHSCFPFHVCCCPPVKDHCRPYDHHLIRYFVGSRPPAMCFRHSFSHWVFSSILIMV